MCLKYWLKLEVLDGFWSPEGAAADCSGCCWGWWGGSLCWLLLVVGPYPNWLQGEPMGLGSRGKSGGKRSKC